MKEIRFETEDQLYIIDLQQGDLFVSDKKFGDKVSIPMKDMRAIIELIEEKQRQERG